MLGGYLVHASFGNRGLKLAWRWRRSINNYDGLRLLAGENQSKHPAEKRYSEEHVDDDSSCLVGAVFSDGRNGRQKI